MQKEKEVWKDVIGFEGRFKISSHGRLLSINGKWKGEKILSPAIGMEGYYSTTMRNGKGIEKTIRIHVLVAEVFHDKPNIPNVCVNHLDGNKLNNYYRNLEWTDLGRNNSHAVRIGIYDIKGERHPNRKLNNEQVYAIKFLRNEFKSHELMNEFKVSREQIRDIRLEKNWRHITKDYKSNNSISVAVGSK